MSFSAMANVWASSSLSHNERKLYTVSNDTARDSRASPKGVAYVVEKQSVENHSAERQKEDSVFKTLNLEGNNEKKEAELSFYWSDILSDKKNYYRNVTATGLTESRTFQIGSYFIISFKYLINKQL